jgi:hypothetical protein
VFGVVLYCRRKLIRFASTLQRSSPATKRTVRKRGNCVSRLESTLCRKYRCFLHFWWHISRTKYLIKSNLMVSDIKNVLSRRCYYKQLSWVNGAQQSQPAFSTRFKNKFEQDNEEIPCAPKAVLPLEQLPSWSGGWGTDMATSSNKDAPHLDIVLVTKH